MILNQFLNKVTHIDAYSGLKLLPDKCVHTCVTSPPYFGLRDYKTEKVNWPDVTFSILGFKIYVPAMECHLGLEDNLNAFIGHLVLIFRETRRVLRDDGTLWLNIGDSYAGHHGNKKKAYEDAPSNKNSYYENMRKSTVTSTLQGGQKNQLNSLRSHENVTTNLKPKDMIGVPWMLAFALREDGWYLRQDIIWHKPNPMPESTRDRCTKAHEYIFLFSKSQRYFYDQQAIATIVTESTIARLTQETLEQQKGSNRAHAGGKSNGRMKAVKPKYAKHGNKGYDHRGKGDKKLTNHSGNYDQDGNLIGVGMANRRSVWSITTKAFTDAHFATFPEELPSLCIRAGTSAYGCCSECGAPWERMTEKELMPTKKAAKKCVVDQRDMLSDKNSQGSNRQKDGHMPGHINKHTTTGWKPTCACGINKLSKPIVMDMFDGAGTTRLVASKLNRDGIGFELSTEYIKISTTRHRNKLGLFYET